MSAYATGRVLVQLSLRSITSHKVKSLIVGGLLAFGTLLLVLGNTFIANTERQMERSITGSLIGHLQVYSEKAKDKPVFFGPSAQNQQDLAVLDNYPKVKAALEQLPNVQAVVPMGRDVAQGVGGNELDEVLGELRRAVQGEGADKRPKLVAHVRKMAELMKADLENRAAISANADELKAQMATLDTVMGDAFWQKFDEEPLVQLDFLDAKVAPLQSDEAAFFLPYIGTDLAAFKQKFERFRVADGQMVPDGQRGFLFNKTYYEEAAKNRVARELDEIRRIMKEDKTTIAKDKNLQERVAKNVRQYRRVNYQLGPEDVSALEGKLKALMPSETGDINALMQAFLKVDDSNFEARYKFFYDEIAPRIRLYRVKIGDTITVRAFTRSGYTRAANLKVWGTFTFEGLDGSLLASRYCLMDLMSFRDLYGLMTPERRKELDAIKAQVGVKDVGRDDAEAALFGGAGEGTLEVEQQATQVAEPEKAQAAQKAKTAELKPFTQEDLDNGVVITASVILKDSKLLRQTQAQIAELSKAQGLGIQSIDWQESAGIIGQFILVIRIVLFVAIGIIFLVALVIINNSMLMATMDRVQEIGTMRAIGAQRSFVRLMFLLETLVLGFFAAAVGSAIAAGIVAFFHKVGLPAGNDILIVLFGGRALHPVLGAGSVIGAVVLIGIVSLVATLYPAVMATRIQPIVAMQRRE